MFGGYNRAKATEKENTAGNAANSNKGSNSFDSRLMTGDKGISYEEPQQFPLMRKNFIWMAIAGAMIVVGFLLMLGGGTSTEAFNPDIFSTRRIVIGPTLAFLGFVAMGVAIIVKPKRD